MTDAPPTWRVVLVNKMHGYEEGPHTFLMRAEDAPAAVRAARAVVRDPFIQVETVERLTP